MALKLNPLSTAKGKKFECEMCGKPATLACQHCRVTYYCSHEHQSVDWFGIHEKICQLLGALRTLRPTLGTEEERQRRNLTVQMSQHALIDLCKNEAHKQLVLGKYELAVPGALQSLRFSMKVHGASGIELVPAFLLLAEANLGLKRYRQAEEFLVYANWSVLQNPTCSNELKAQLYRNFGRLYASQGRYEEALKQLAHDVYYSSVENGPEHFATAGGYYQMARVFMSKGDVEHALAFMDKVVDIWYKFLMKLKHRENDVLSDFLGEAQVEEAEEMLMTIVATRTEHLGKQHLATGEVLYARALLKDCDHKLEEARDLYEAALEIYVMHLGRENDSTRAIIDALSALQSTPYDQQQQPQQQEQQAHDDDGVSAQLQRYLQDETKHTGSEEEKQPDIEPATTAPQTKTSAAKAEVTPGPVPQGVPIERLGDAAQFAPESSEPKEKFVAT